MKLSGGYTLIEVLIVIAILASLVLVAAPLTGSWLNASHLQESGGQLKEAVSRAKSIALRNAIAATGDTPVSAVCLNATRELSVRQSTIATPLNCPTAVGEKSWQAKVSEKIGIKQNSTVFICVCFDNKALVTTAGTCLACSGDTEFEISAGGDTPRPFAIY